MQISVCASNYFCCPCNFYIRYWVAVIPSSSACSRCLGADSEIAKLLFSVSRQTAKNPIPDTGGSETTIFTS